MDGLDPAQAQRGCSAVKPSSMSLALQEQEAEHNVELAVDVAIRSSSSKERNAAKGNVAIGS